MSDYDPRYLKFVELFNEQKFFEAHEVLELAWHATKRKDNFYKGLIQVAAALHLVGKGRYRGAKELLKRSQEYLTAYTPAYRGVNLKKLLADLDEVVWRIQEEGCQRLPTLVFQQGRKRS